MSNNNNSVFLDKNEKMWHWDGNNPEISKADTKKKDFSYALIPATALDILKVHSFYCHHPMPGKVIKSVKVIYNPDMNRGFKSYLTFLKNRHDNPLLKPKWSHENDSEWREAVYEECIERTKSYQDSDFPDVKIMPLWHGTTQKASENIYKGGYADLALNDTGFFGRGLYFTYEAEYACRYGSKYILNWVSFSFPYPVIKDDMEKLKGQGHYQNYDAHYIPVVPKDPNNVNEIYYYPCNSDLQIPVYTEIVVFQAFQALPRYEVELGPESEDILKTIKTNLSDEVYFLLGNSLMLTGQYSNALFYLKMAAEKKYPPAYIRLAWLYAEGGRVGEQDKKESDIWYQKAGEQIEWFQKQAKNNNPEALFDLALCYENGLGITKDSKKAFELYQKAAQKGHSEAQVNLGHIFYNLGNVKNDESKENYKRAFEWFQKAAKLGNVRAQNNLGSCYYNGKGVHEDFKLAVKWYLKAARKGHSTAQNSLGHCSSQGKGVIQDEKLAFEWFEKGAKQGNPDAQNNLGKCYFNGWGVASDYNKAFEWFEKAAKQGNLDAQNSLGECYSNGRGVAKDLKEAFKWYEKSANQGHMYASNNLGKCYYKGTGMPKNHNEAFIWFKISSASSNFDSFNNLGKCYFKGHGTAQDYRMAFICFQKAAEKGNAEAQRNMGTLYRYGLHLEKNNKKSFEWYLKAANQGNAAAQNSAGDCYLHGLGIDRNEVMAFNWYQTSANQENIYAYVNLGNCYLSGFGVKQDYKKAIEFYQKAAEHKNEFAQFFLSYCYYKGNDESKALKWWQPKENGNSSEKDNQIRIPGAFLLTLISELAQEVTKKTMYEFFNLDLSKCAIGFPIEIKSNEHAQISLRSCYCKMACIDHVRQKVFEWVQKKGEQGNPDEQNYLGRCYDEGWGIEQNYEKAFFWFSKAVKLGNADAKLNLAGCYGHGINEDEKECLDWLLKAANQGRTVAQLTLIMKYLQDLDNNNNNIKVWEWLEKAARQGSMYAQITLGNCFENGEGIGKDLKKAFKWYLEAAKQNNRYAQKLISYFYYEGLGIAKNHKHALEWYRKAECIDTDIKEKKVVAMMVEEFKHVSDPPSCIIL